MGSIVSLFIFLEYYLVALRISKFLKKSNIELLSYVFKSLIEKCFLQTAVMTMTRTLISRVMNILDFTRKVLTYIKAIVGQNRL